jgi:hypothetical protein
MVPIVGIIIPAFYGGNSCRVYHGDEDASKTGDRGGFRINPFQETINIDNGSSMIGNPDSFL